MSRVWPEDTSRCCTAEKALLPTVHQFHHLRLLDANLYDKLWANANGKVTGCTSLGWFLCGLETEYMDLFVVARKAI